MDTLFIFARLHAKPGCEAAIVDAMRAVSEPTRAEPGCREVGFYRSTRDPLEFYLHSRWVDRAAFDLHATFAHTRHFIATAQELIDHPFRLSFTQSIDEAVGAFDAGP